MATTSLFADHAFIPLPDVPAIPLREIAPPWAPFGTWLARIFLRFARTGQCAVSPSDGLDIQAVVRHRRHLPGFACH